MEEDYYFDDFSYEGGGYGDSGEWDFDEDWYYDDYDDEDYGYGSYDFDYSNDEYSRDNVYDEDYDYESDGKGGWNFSLGGVPDTLKDFATGLAGNYAQQSIGQKYWKQRTDYEDSLRAKWFDMENKYNSPVAMAARLRAAGLNPALVLGGASGAGAMAGSVGRRSAAGGSAPVLGSPITAPSKLAELNVMDSVANKNNAEAERAESDVTHNSFMNRLAEAQTGVQNALAGVHSADAAGKRINNNIQKMAYESLNATYDVVTGTSPDGSVSYHSKIKGYMVDTLKQVVQLSNDSMHNSALAQNFPALVKSVGDGFATVGANLLASLSNARLSELAASVKDETMDSEIFRDKARNYTDAGLQVVDRILDAFKVGLGYKGKSMFTTYADGNGEITGGKNVVIK